MVPWTMSPLEPSNEPAAMYPYAPCTNPTTHCSMSMTQVALVMRCSSRGFSSSLLGKAQRTAMPLKVTTARTALDNTNASLSKACPRMRPPAASPRTSTRRNAAAERPAMITHDMHKAGAA